MSSALATTVGGREAPSLAAIYDPKNRQDELKTMVAYSYRCWCNITELTSNQKLVASCRLLGLFLFLSGQRRRFGCWCGGLSMTCPALNSPWPSFHGWAVHQELDHFCKPAPAAGLWPAPPDKCVTCSKEAETHLQPDSLAMLVLYHYLICPWLGLEDDVAILSLTYEDLMVSVGDCDLWPVYLRLPRCHLDLLNLITGFVMVGDLIILCLMIQSESVFSKLQPVQFYCAPPHPHPPPPRT